MFEDARLDKYVNATYHTYIDVDYTMEGCFSFMNKTEPGFQ